jgi:predicted O-methyltransferase YrrM
MTKVNLILRYISYKLFSKHRRGHGIHSPFVYSLIREVFNRHGEKTCFQEIERIRKKYIANDDSVAVSDFGAGSRTCQKQVRKLSEIVRSSAIPARYGRMLYYLVNHYQPEFIVELGTSAGISTAYLASANPAIKVFTIEGDKSISQIAGDTFQDLKLKNIELITGTFENAIDKVAKKVSGKLLVFIDGNHQYHSVLDYFHKFIFHSGECLIIFDDIRWSDDMLKAWNIIRSDKEVKISIDLFFMGIVLLNTNIPKQHFVIGF